MAALQTVHVALVALTQKARFEQVVAVASALQRQVITDFGPIWQVSATVSAVPSPDAVPPDHWRIHIVEAGTVGPGGVLGNHRDDAGQPIAQVGFGPTWSLTASHELLEMLADPGGDRLTPGTAPDGSDRPASFLVEVCDPVQDPTCAYHVNGVLVSDFCTPRFYGFPAAVASAFSFKDHLSAAAAVADGGTLAWRDAGSGRWFQMVGQAGGPRIDELGFIDVASLSTRTQVNQRSPPYAHLSDARFPEARQARIDSRLAALNEAMASKAGRIERLLAGGFPPAPPRAARRSSKRPT